MNEYLTSLYQAIPNYIYEMLLSIFCISSMILIIWKGKLAFRYICRVLIVEYLFLIYCSTFIFREVRNTNACKLEPFWSYNVPTLLYENIMNVVVFLVLGILIRFSIKFVSWWQALLSGLVISVSIEILQYIFNRGTCDIDDIIHNTTGCFLGWSMAFIFCRSIRVK